MRTRKNTIIKGMVVLATVACATLFFTGSTSEAKVKYSLKKGTLTVSGKGAMKKVYTNNKKIKKVVIKKGVTSICDEAFYRCKNLKHVKFASTVKKIEGAAFAGTGLTKVTVPKKCKKFGEGAFSGCNLKSLTLPGDFQMINTAAGEDYYPIVDSTDTTDVYFSTDLNVSVVKRVRGNNYYVSDTDDDFTSIDGVIYTKDGKTIVRVPSGRTEVEVKAGCEVFPLSSVLYAIDIPDQGDEPVCGKLTSVILPESIQTIGRDDFLPGNDDANYLSYPIDLDIRTKNLSDDELYTLATSFKIACEKLATDFPEHFSYTDGMLIGDETTVYRYEGTLETVTVPDVVTEIADGAFVQNRNVDDYNAANESLKKVVLPDGILIIGEGAFSGRTALTQINFPASLTHIGTAAFHWCPLGDLTMDDHLFEIGSDGAFAGSHITSVTIPEDVTEIPANFMSDCIQLTHCNVPAGLTAIGDSAFYNCDKMNIEEFLSCPTLTYIGQFAFRNICRETLTIPENVLTIGEEAFGLTSPSINKPSYKTREFIIKGDTSDYADNTFGYHDSDMKTKLTFESGIESSFVTPLLRLYGVEKKGKKYAHELGLEWTSVTDADGIRFDFCSDKKGKNVIKTVKVTKSINTKKFKLTLSKKINSIRVSAYQGKVSGKETTLKIEW